MSQTKEPDFKMIHQEVEDWYPVVNGGKKKERIQRKEHFLENRFNAIFSR